MRRQPITIIQGGQYGSESKGAITGYICETEAVDIAIRTGAVNAGHTVYYQDKKMVMQQLPCGWVNPNTRLVLGAGAMIHPEILAAECKMVSDITGSDVHDRLWIDHNAGVHNAAHTQRSTESGRHYSIGATGKGCSEAIIDKIRGRGAGYATFGMLGQPLYQVADTVSMLNREYDRGAKLLIEGTQGTLLDLNIGPYPYTTHKSVLPAAWMAECGLSPALPTDIVMVVRTYPIRVAGNSGPMPYETSWPDIAREINRKRGQAGVTPIVAEWAIDSFEKIVRACACNFKMPKGSDGLDQHIWADREKYKEALSELHATTLKHLTEDCVAELSRLFEFTTVTKKLRRVARLDYPTLEFAGKLCRPHRIALTFMNYQFPLDWFQKPTSTIPESQLGYMRGIGATCGAPIALVSYGPGPEHVLRLV